MDAAQVTLDDDDTLRFWFASALAGAGAAEGCPAPERLVDAADGRLAPDDAAVVVDHVGACPVCAEGWRLLVLDRRRR